MIPLAISTRWNAGRHRSGEEKYGRDQKPVAKAEAHTDNVSATREFHGLMARRSKL